MHYIKQYNLIILFMMMLCTGIGIGSIYLMKVSNENYTYIKEYLTSFMNTVDNLSKTTVFKNSLYENIIMVVAIFMFGFFKYGIIAVAACIIKKGFVMGFTSASMLKCFGIKGMLVNVAYLPSIVVALPILMLFSAASVKNDTNNTKIRKKLPINYIIFAIITITIFCVSSFLEAYLTTTFMKILSESLVQG